MTPLLEQTVLDGGIRHRRILKLPPPTAEVLPGVLWGRPEVLFTPAFWAATWWLSSDDSRFEKRIADRKTFAKEVVACLLGGYGISFELNRAAFIVLDQSGVFEHAPVDERILINHLSTPLKIGERTVRYRFPQQKGRYVAAALRRLSSFDPSSLSDRELRAWLMELPGVGYKTASWIVRNWNGSNDVAIIDIHILRAGLIMGLFDPKHDPSRHYPELEQRFLEFAKGIGVPASELDLLMWENMRITGKIGIAATKERLSQI